MHLRIFTASTFGFVLLSYGENNPLCINVFVQKITIIKKIETWQKMFMLQHHIYPLTPFHWNLLTVCSKIYKSIYIYIYCFFFFFFFSPILIQNSFVTIKNTHWNLFKGCLRKLVNNSSWGADTVEYPLLC